MFFSTGLPSTASRSSGFIAAFSIKSKLLLPIPPHVLRFHGGKLKNPIELPRIFGPKEV